MNPIVKNIALKLCDTAPACLLEIFFETLIKTWNEYIREFNLPFKSIDIADIKGVIMDRETGRNNDIRNITYPNDTSQNMSSESILTGQDKLTFFDYFYHHIQGPNYQSSLNISSNGISLDKDRNLATNTFSEGLPVKAENRKDPVSGKVDEDITLIDFTDTEDLNPNVDGMSNSQKDHVAASEHLEFKGDAANSVDLLEPRTHQDLKPADTISDLKAYVVVSENGSFQEVNHGIGDTLNQNNFTEPIDETLPKLFENDNCTPCSVITLKRHSQINDNFTLQQELNTKSNKDRNVQIASDVVKPEGFLKQNVILFEDTLNTKEKDLLKSSNISEEEECPQNGGGQTELDERGEKDLIDLRLSIDKNLIDCKTQVSKQPEIKLGEFGEINLLVFRSSTDENSKEGEAQVLKLDRYEVSGKEVDIVSDKFAENRDIENGCRELDFEVKCTNNVTNEKTDKNERFDRFKMNDHYQLNESDLSKKFSVFKKFNTEGTENVRQKPNWSLLEGGENDLSPDVSLSLSNPRKETSENINGIIGLQMKVENMEDPLIGKADEDISLIDFTDTEDLNPEVDGKSNSRIEHVAARTDLEFKDNEASSVHLLEPRTNQNSKPADTINNLKSDVVVSEKVCFQEVNHGIGDTPFKTKLAEPIDETLLKLTENPNYTPYNVSKLKLHSQMNILSLQQELNIKNDKDRDMQIASDASDVKPNDFLKQNVILFGETLYPKERDLLKLCNISEKEECPQNSGGQNELDEHGEKNLIDLRLPILKNLIDCKTQISKEQQTDLGEFDERDLPVFRSSTDENSKEGEAHVFKMDTYEESDKEVIAVTDKFAENKDIENGCRELGFAVNRTNNVTNEITDTNERFDRLKMNDHYQLNKSDLSTKSSVLKQFNTESIENVWQEPSWSLLKGGENDLSQDISLCSSKLRKETSENINGIIDLPKVFNENNTATKDKCSNNNISMPEELQKAVTNNNLLGDLIEQEFKETNIDPFSTIQADTGKQLEHLKNQMNVPEETVFTLLFEYESPSNKRQEPMGIDSSTKQKSREIVAANKDKGDDNKREIMQPEDHEIEIANELKGVSIDKNKGDMKTKEGLAYNKYSIPPISNRPLTTSHQDTNLVHDSQRLKTGTEQYLRIKYIDRNTPRTYKVALEQMENSNNLNSQGNERVHGEIGKEVKQSTVYPSRRMTIGASWKSDGREHPKPQKKVSDDNKSHELSLDLNPENINIEKIGSKNCNKPLQKPFYSKNITNKALNKKSCKPSITLASDIQERIHEGSSQHKLGSNTQNVQNWRTPVIGSCSKCIKLSPLEIARRNLINRNITVPESVLDVRQNLRRIRSASKSVERTKRNQSLSRTTRMRPSKKVSFTENEKIFSYDPNKSVVENFSRAVTAKIKREESAIGKEQFVVAGNCEKQDGVSNENLGEVEGYTNPCFVDVPLFDCLPDCEIDPPIANVANFDEDDLLLRSSPTPQDRKLSQKLSVVSRKAEGNMRRWLKYGVVVRKKMRSVMRARK